MLNRFIDMISVPFEPQDVKTNRDNIVNALINILFLITFLYIVIGLVRDGFSVQILLLLGIIGGGIIAQLFLRRGNAKSVSTIFSVSLWGLVMALFLFFENGLRAPAFMAVFMFLIMYVGLLHGRTAAISITIITILVSAVIVVLEFRGIYLTEPKVPDVLFSLIAEVIFFPMTAFLITRTLRNLTYSITLFREKSDALELSELSLLQAHQELELAYETTLEGWSRALELKDKETEGHSRRVTQLAIDLGRSLGMSEVDIKHLYYGALLHDIGKMGIPDEILHKTGTLTAEEREIINQHPIYAYNLLSDIQHLKLAVDIPYSHHENWDGTGYPQGLQAEEIPFCARIFAVVDNWDALTSNRPYRAAWSKEKTRHYIQSESGKKFDPEITARFLDMLSERDKA